jgi:lipoprotein-releasing system permease protein
VYKLLLCFRYLRTRYLALICIVSVMLGVATLIVVNSVMSGFSTKLRDRLHALLSDVVIEAPGFDGFGDPGGKMELIRNDPFLRDKIVAMTPTLEIFAMFQYRYHGEPLARPVRLVGIDFDGRCAMGDFRKYLVPVVNGAGPTFELTDEARRRLEQNNQRSGFHLRDLLPKAGPGEPPVPDPPPESEDDAPVSALVGWAILHFHRPGAKADDPDRDICTLEQGEEFTITTLSGERLRPVNYRYVVSGYFKAEMSEQDANLVFVPLEHLQHLRTMGDRVTSIQIGLRDYDCDAKAVVTRLHEIFRGAPLEIQTWEDKQGPLLAAIGVEKGILNVLLFMIVGVAGFSILAIFSMIVVEKTRDIGILKSLGASNGGVALIFVSYGLLLGVVGCILGSAMGLAITNNINRIHREIAAWTGHEIFSGDVYYFSEIPTNVVPLTVILVNVGAVAIAVIFSVLPAVKAMMLHPVRALRYE